MFRPSKTLPRHCTFSTAHTTETQMNPFTLFAADLHFARGLCGEAPASSTVRPQMVSVSISPARFGEENASFFASRFDPRHRRRARVTAIPARVWYAAMYLILSSMPPAIRIAHRIHRGRPYPALFCAGTMSVSVSSRFRAGTTVAPSMSWGTAAAVGISNAHEPTSGKICRISFKDTLSPCRSPTAPALAASSHCRDGCGLLLCARFTSAYWKAKIMCALFKPASLAFEQNATRPNPRTPCARNVSRSAIVCHRPGQSRRR